MNQIMEIAGVLYGIVALWGVVTYILQAISLQSLAKRRNVQGSWLAWMPFGNVWLLGAIGDRYQLAKAGRRTKRAASLLTLTILAVVFAVISGICLGVSGAYLSGHSLEPGSALVMVLGVLFLIATVAVAIVLKITDLVACHTLYRSCKADAAAAFVVLSIFFFFLKPFFLLASCRHDEGFLQ